MIGHNRARLCWLVRQQSRDQLPTKAQERINKALGDGATGSVDAHGSVAAAVYLAAAGYWDTAASLVTQLNPGDQTNLLDTPSAAAPAGPPIQPSYQSLYLSSAIVALFESRGATRHESVH